MILYHTGKKEIRNPDIHYGRKNADFGWGFYLSPEDAVKLLMIGPEYTQAAIRTEKVLKQLRFIKSEKIEGFTGEALKVEKDAYLEALGRELNKIIEG